MNNQERDKNQNEIQSEKSGFTKFLIVILLLAVLAGAAWGAIKIVKNFPEAIDSLASIADTVYNYDPKEDIELSINTDRNVLNSGETVSIWWNKTKQGGDYSFSYACQEGVAIDLREDDVEEFVSVACDTKHKLNDSEHIMIRVESEKNRFSDVDFVITFETDDEDDFVEDSSKITIVNTSISDSVAIDDKTEEDESSNYEQTDNLVDENDTYNNEEVQSNDHSPIPPQPQYTYEIPVSNPNGQTDLVLSNLKIGYVNNIGIFIESANAVSGFDKVVKFTVHNIGTKTSEDWAFEVNTLKPFFTSDNQKPLKPNERSTLFVRLPNVDHDELQSISIFIETKNDANINNNYLQLIN